jgi:signal transduction histidine kinase
MVLKNEVKQYLVEHLAGQQSFIGEEVVLAIRSSGEISSSERLTDQDLVDHFPRLFADLIEYFLKEVDPGTRSRTIEAALSHGKTRWQQGYHLVEVVRELAIVERSILDHGIEKFFEENSQWINDIDHARRILDFFFEDSVAGSVQRYVENYTDQLQTANAKLSIVNQNLSRIDESRLRLIRTVSHELANVLNALTGTVSLISTGNDEAIRAEMLDSCQRNVREMSELLADLKDYSVLISGAAPVQIEEIDVAIFASEIKASFHAMAQEAGVHFDLRIDSDLEVVRSDRRKIRQIVTNLVTNAINYCGRDRPDKSVLLEFGLAGNSWQISVKDTGIGIPPEHLDSIFDEFKRVSFPEVVKGAGLGLAITKRLVEELHGTIEVVSEMGQGSRFAVTIPKGM